MLGNVIISIRPQDKCIATKPASRINMGGFRLPGFHRRGQVVDSVDQTQVLKKVILAIECSEGYRLLPAYGNSMGVNVSLWWASLVAKGAAFGSIQLIVVGLAKGGTNELLQG